MKAILYARKNLNGTKWIAEAENGRRCLGVSCNAAWQALGRTMGMVLVPGDKVTEIIVGTIEEMSKVGLVARDEGLE